MSASSARQRYATTPKTVRPVIAPHESAESAPVRAPREHNYDDVAELVADATNAISTLKCAGADAVTEHVCEVIVTAPDADWLGAFTATWSRTD